jgi:hypothetical protein
MLWIGIQRLYVVNLGWNWDLLETVIIKIIMSKTIIIITTVIIKLKSYQALCKKYRRIKKSWYK